MTGNVYLAKKSVQQQPDVLQNLVSIDQLSRRAADMIQQLLTFARKGMVSKKELPLTPFMTELMRFFQTTMPENIHIKQDICMEPLSIYGDSTQIHQILMNLINNARDAVEDVHAPCITITLKAFTADKTFIAAHPDCNSASYAHLCISDNGSGINTEHLEHIFEPFYTTKEQGKGTGLGLSMVYGAVHTHDGFVDVDSCIGQDTTFHLYFPLIETTAETQPVQQQRSIEGQGELILIADDEDMARETMAEVVKAMGYRVVTAADGLIAVDVFKQHQQEISLALLDVVMPHLGGVQLAKRIKNMNADLPIIFLTGYDREHVLNGNEALENTEILSKPVNFNTLSHSIRQMLETNKQ